MTECLRGDGLMKSAAVGLIRVVRGANDTGTHTYHLDIANKCLCLITLLKVSFYLNCATYNRALFFLPIALAL